MRDDRPVGGRRYRGYESRLWSLTGFGLDGFLELSTLWAPSLVGWGYSWSLSRR